MRLGRREVEILRFLMQRKETDQSELVSELKIKKSNLSRYIKNLSGFGLVNINPAGRNNRVNISQALFSEYNKLGNPNLERIVYGAITGRNPYLISYFYGREFGIKNMHMPPATAKRTLAGIRNLGIAFMKRKGVYEMRQEMERLSEFCRHFLYIMHLELAKNTIGPTSSFFVSQGPTEWAVLGVTERNIQSKSYFPTAYDVFNSYGIRLMLTKRHYYTNVKPKIEDVVIHALVLSVGNLPHPWLDTRGILYACALIIKNHITYEKLAKVEHRFGLSDESLKNIFKFVDSKGGKTFPGFPSWKEVEGVAYGI